MERVSVGITELDLNMLVVGFDRSGTDPQFFRDTVCSKAGTNQPKDMQLAVGQVRGAGGALPGGRSPCERRPMRSLG